MKITKLRLVKYLRITESVTNVFEINPTAPTQFIIGTNGSGKSSIMYELSPLPAEKAFYAKGGSKEIHLTHDGSFYVLISNFEEGQHHHFLKDGKELNEGGTITVQKELVKQHLRYTSEIHQMVTGARRFHQMSLSERKYWFTTLADADYEYAINVFNKIKDRARDVSGALKLAKKRLVIESSKLIPQEEFDALKRSCDALYEQVQFLIEHRQIPEHNVNDLGTGIEAEWAKIEYSAKTLLRRIKTLRKELPNTEEGITAEINRLQSEIAVCQSLSQRFYDEHSKVAQLFEAWQQSRLESIAEIDKEITQAEKDKEAAQASLLLKLEQQAPAQVVLASCETIEQWLPSVIDGLVNNRELQWGRAAFAILNEEIDALGVQINTENNKAARAQQIIDHQRQHKDDEEVKCPRCSHGFKLSFDPLVLEDAVKAQALYKTQVESLQEQLAKKQELRTKMSDYFTTYKHVVSTLNATPGMGVFCLYLQQNEIITNSPEKIGLYLSHFKRDAGQWSVIERSEQRITSTRDLLEKTMGSENASSHDIAERKVKLEHEIADNEQRKRSLALDIEQLQRHQRDLKQITELQTLITEAQENCSKLTINATETLRRQIYNELLRNVQSNLATQEQALRASERQQSVINAVTDEINGLIQDEEALKLLMKELSPTEGLIAEGLFGFMKTFIREMNKIIKLVWTYPLVVKPCALESSDSLSLNYKFPMDVGGSSQPRKDVSEGSDGMLEMIDLSFRISAMKALRIGDYPLCLDEFGKTLDVTHKQATIGLLSAIIELDQFEQLFMISHDVVQYGSLGTAEICVLHAANIQLPPNCVFNKHVILQ